MQYTNSNRVSIDNNNAGKGRHRTIAMWRGRASVWCVQSITLTRQTDEEVSAYVANGKSYSVTLTAGHAFCGCGNSMFRGKCCNHGVALALFVIRTPKMEMKTEEPAANLLLITLPELAKVRRWV